MPQQVCQQSKVAVFFQEVLGKTVTEGVGGTTAGLIPYFWA